MIFLAFKVDDPRQAEEGIQYAIDQLNASLADQNVRINENHRHLNHKIDALQGDMSQIKNLLEKMLVNQSK